MPILVSTFSEDYHQTREWVCPIRQTLSQSLCFYETWDYQARITIWSCTVIAKARWPLFGRINFWLPPPAFVDPMRLLVVEDEKITAEYLKKGLAENGYDVEVAFDGVSGISKVLEGQFDLLVLDVNLPGKDGWTVLKEIRSRGIQVPVLFLTARDLVQDRVKGLLLGADDYLIKPFAFSELLARLRVIARRSRENTSNIWTAGDIKLDVAGMTAERGGRRLDLSPKDFALLAFLVRRQGQVQSRSVILKQVWNIDFDPETNVVEVAIGRLRDKVDGPHQLKAIRTVRGSGYVLMFEE